MISRALIWLTLLAAPILSMGQAQEIYLSSSEEGVEIRDNGYEGITIGISLPRIYLSEVITNIGLFSQLESELLSRSFRIGYPNIPSLSHLIEVPSGAEVSFRVLGYKEQVIDLNALGYNPIIPAQPSLAKSEEPSKATFTIDSSIYSTDTLLYSNICRIEEAGALRATRLGRVELFPIQYNPVRNTLRILNELEVEIVFEYKPTAKSVRTSSTLASPFFRSIPGAINQLPVAKSLVNDVPVTYVIVSDPMFMDALQPFIEWKRLKGFHVIEAYTNNPEVGNTTTSIKSYLQDLYNNPPEGVNSPTFGLLVGDVQQIPSFSGAGNHITDLYYFEYTNDKIPEVFYGRFSAQTVEQLIPQIQKTLEYEQYLMGDPSYLSNHILVAGVDRSYATVYGNGHIRYTHSYYSNPDNSVTPYTYLYNDLAGSTSGLTSNSSDAAISIRSKVSSGAGWVNYTAHCGPSGWSNPSFTTTHIPNLTNEGKYGIWINNCCESNRFNNNQCFGEAALRAEGKGAVGFIGASNLTYWDEDYFFAVGVGTPVANPSYSDFGPGFYDALFHTQPNEINDPNSWFISLGQLNVAGNLAVQASSSNRKNYYWEVYHLMGDPSLIPYLRVPDPMDVTIDPEVLTIGVNQISVTCAPNAQVALSQNGELLAIGFSNNQGNTTLSLGPKGFTVGDAILVITAQNYIPHIDTIPISVANQPYISLRGVTPEAPLDYGQTAQLSITLKNIAPAPYGVTNTRASLSSSSPYVSILADSVHVGAIGSETEVHVPNAFTIDIANNVPDQTSLQFKITIRSDYNTEQYKWDQQFSLKANAPILQIGSPYFHVDGADKFELDPGDQGSIIVPITNIGHASTLGIDATFTSLTDNLLQIHDSTPVSLPPLGVGESGLVSTYFNASAQAPLGSLAEFRLTASSNGYSIQKDFELPIGHIPSYYMGGEREVNVSVLYFYDSGGPEANYSNNERDTITFYPTNTDAAVFVTFELFDLETDYDFLYIFDGPSTSSPPIPGSPFTGRAITNQLLSSHSTGALTFVFVSDQSITRSGWEALVESINMKAPPACTHSPSPGEGTFSGRYPTPFAWSFAPGATEYEFYIGEGALPNSPVISTTNSILYELSDSTSYQWRVVPRNSFGAAEGCPIWEFTTGSQHIVMHNGELSVCGVEFFDSGGPQGAYSNNEDLVLTVYPDSLNHLLVNFSEINLENGYDFLYVYDGPDTLSPILSEITGNSLPTPMRSTNPYGALTFRFVSDRSVTASGWRALLQCATDSVDVSITITDANGDPIENALVALAGLSRITNNEGIAFFTVGSMQKLVVSVLADGYPEHIEEFEVQNNPIDLTIELHIKYYVTLSATIASGGVVQGGGLYPVNGEVTVTASPKPNYVFGGWFQGDSLISNLPEYTFIMPGKDISLTAHFYQVYYLTLITSPSGTGFLSGSGFYMANSLVQINATPVQGYQFVGWYNTLGQRVTLTDGGYTMPASTMLLIALFSPIDSFPVIIWNNIVKGGSAIGSGLYASGETVELTAFPSQGYKFVSWVESGEVLSTNNPYSFQMPSHSLNIQLVFDLLNPAEEVTEESIRIYPNPFNSSITVSGQGIERVLIHSVLGAIVREVKPTATQTRVDTQTLPSGIYLMVIYRTNGERSTLRMVKP